MFEAAETTDALEVPVFEAHLWCFNEHSRVCAQGEDQRTALSTLARARSRTEAKQHLPEEVTLDLNHQNTFCWKAK